MDPNACWLAFCEAIDTGDREHIIDNAEALIDWLNGGGFQPTVTAVLQTRTQIIYHLQRVLKAARST